MMMRFWSWVGTTAVASVPTVVTASARTSGARPLGMLTPRVTYSANARMYSSVA